MRAFVPLAMAVFGLMKGCEGAFVLLNPEDYRDGFIEGWPGPYSNGTGAGEVVSRPPHVLRCST